MTEGICQPFCAPKTNQGNFLQDSKVSVPLVANISTMHREASFATYIIFTDAHMMSIGSAGRESATWKRKGRSKLTCEVVVKKMNISEHVDLDTMRPAKKGFIYRTPLIGTGLDW